MSSEPPVLGARFELGEWLGEGSLSVVHAATDRLTGRSVAVKLARSGEHPDTVRRRFEREAAALAVIASAHVVELISAGTADDGRPFLALERLDGRDLQQLIDEHGPLKPTQVVRFLGQAARALELAHGLGIVHRDLKPANLFLHATAERQVVVKVLDLGMAVDVAGPTERARDAFGGTPMYMAPEQVRGQLTRIGPATDIWALGVVAVTLLTGQAVWAGLSTEEVLRAIEALPVERPSLRWPWLPDAFDAWFARSTQRVPERRFRDVAEQAARLGEVLRGVVAPGSTGASGGGRAAARTPTPSVVRVTGQRTVCVGRDLECGEIEQRLGPATVVTLIGTAGIGKTRLAQAVCERAGDRFVDGAWFVPLGAGDDVEAVVATIAGVLGLPPDTTRPVFDRLVDSLALRRLLIVVDGTERVPGCAAALDRLRRACPQTSWLATGRLPLGIETERCVGVEPLDLPGPRALTAGEAETYSAVELFVRCARLVAPTFALDFENLDDVVAICRALEGFPLGIELAAAQVASDPPALIRAELEAGTTGPSSVRRAVGWSYGRLTPGEQAMLRHLAVLPAGLSFEQVQRRLGHLTDDPVGAVLRLAHSHLVAWSSDRPARLVMLDTVRELCGERAAEIGETPALWQVACAHAEEVAEAGTPGAGPEGGLALLDAEHDNLRTVLSHLLDTAPAAGLRLAGKLAWYWYLRGHYVEGARWLEDAIARSGGAAGEDMLRGLLGAGRLALLRCRYVHAAGLLGRAQTMARGLGDARGEASAVQLLGSVARERGDYPQAQALHRRGLELWLALDDPREAGRARSYLLFASWLGDPDGSSAITTSDSWLRDGEQVMRQLGDAEGIVWTLLNQGAVAHHRGALEPAREALGLAFAEAIAARFHEGIAWALELIGRTSLARGEPVQARAQLAASLRVHRRLGDLWRCASVLEALAEVAITTDRAARGAMYLGAAEAIREEIQAPVPVCERALLDATVERGAELLADAFRVGRERGRRTSLDAIVELAREA